MLEKKIKDKNEIYSQKIKAGKRTYFFDVKSTRSKDYYLTITESKKKIKEDSFFYEKHKIFLYKEDLNKFNLIDAINHAINNKKLIQDDYHKLRELFNSNNQLSSDRIADFVIKSIYKFICIYK